MCLNGGRAHAWKGTGLDVTRAGALVHTARCTWCDHTATRKVTTGSKPIRDGVRVAP